MPELKTVSTLRSVLALVLMLWCAGTGCILVSYARAAAKDTGESAQMGDRMGLSTLMNAHACCKAKRRPVRPNHPRAEPKLSPAFAELRLLTIPPSPTQPGVMNCCPLTTASIAVASRSQNSDQSITLQRSHSTSLLLVTSDPSPFAVPLRLPNRADSYLLGCAFLI